MPEIESGDDKEIVFFTMFHVKYFCGIVHDVVDKHVYV